MKKTHKAGKPVSADAIARLADQGRTSPLSSRARAGWWRAALRRARFRRFNV
jgi:hypothetical protein